MPRIGARALRYTALLIALVTCTTSTAIARAANWVPNPSAAGQWIDLDSRKSDDEVVRFNVSLSRDDKGQPSTDEQDLVIEILNCENGNRVMVLPMLNNDTRHLPTLSQDDPLFRLICN